MLSEQSLPHLLLDSVPSAVVYIKKDLTFRYANKNYADWIGRLPSDIMGKPVKEFMADEIYRRFKSYMDKALKGESVQFEEQMQYKDGEKLIRASYTPDLNAAGEIEGFIVILNDVTEQKKD